MDFIDQFEGHYDYDCTYMRKLQQASPAGFQTFVDFLPMGRFVQVLSADIIWTARIAAMLTEDCGACVQLNIKIALEAGVEAKQIENLVKNPQKLAAEYRLIFDFAQAVASNNEKHFELQKSMAKKYSPREMAELALAVASAKIYPTLKRAMGEFKSCELYDLDFTK